MQPQTRSPRQAPWKEWNEEHETSLVNPENDSENITVSASRLFRGGLGKARSNAHTCAMPRRDMHSRRALIIITKRSTPSSGIPSSAFLLWRQTESPLRVQRSHREVASRYRPRPGTWQDGGTRSRTTRLIEREQSPAVKYDGRIFYIFFRWKRCLTSGRRRPPEIAPAGPGGPSSPALYRRAYPHWRLWQPRRFDPIIIIESSGVIQPYPLSFSSYDEVWTTTFNSKVKYSCLSEQPILAAPVGAQITQPREEGSLDAKVDTYVKGKKGFTHRDSESAKEEWMKEVRASVCSVV